VRDLEAARDALVEARRTRRWAEHYPVAEANLDNLNAAMLAGGLLEPVRRTLSINSQISFTSLCAALQADADALRDGLRRRDDEAPDPHLQPIWEDSDEGRRAIALANDRIRQGLAPRNVHQAGWGE
jgi:hypothetical protein